MTEKIFLVIAYDIVNDKTRTKLSELLEGYGNRTNFSVFECMLTSSQINKLKAKIEKIVDKETDIILYYYICKSCFFRREMLGGVKEKHESVNYY